MRTAGEVVRVDVATEPSGRSKGFALVDFADPAGAAAAIGSLADYELDGRPLLVRADGARPGGGGGQQAAPLQQPGRTVIASHAPAGGGGHVYGSAALSGGGECRVFVGNLDWQVGWQDLKDVLRAAGEVAHVDILTEAGGRSKVRALALRHATLLAAPAARPLTRRRCVLPWHPPAMRCCRQGCAIAQFVNPAGALNAINTLQDVTVGSRAIWLREDREAPPAGGHGGGGHGGGGGVEANKRVYVGNLAWQVTAADLEPLMRSAGKVLNIRVLTESDGRSKGCALVEFANVNAAYKAIATLRDVEVRGRPIFLREDREA